MRLGLTDQPPVGLPGEGFLRGTLICTRALAEAEPALAQRLVRVMQRTLAWRRTHSAEEVAARLGLAGDEARAMVEMLRRYPQQFSADGRFSAAQLRESEAFFRETLPAGSAAPPPLSAMVIDTWAGRKP